MRVLIGILAIVACLFLMQAAARFGFSRLIARYALIANSTPAADEAVRLNPSDPDTHRTRAIVFTRLRQPAEAVKSLEAATSLRYRDDYLWIDLGNAREEVGDASGALVAFDQAVRWAPHYAHTHWQRGNVLLRMSRTAEAFDELRTAVDANPSYLPSMIDLAWGISREDVDATDKLLAIKDDTERLALIRYLANKGKGNEVKGQLRLLSAPLSNEDKEEVVRRLFTARAFSDAFDLGTPSIESRTPSVFNAGFEDSKILNEPGFGGWFRSPGQAKIRMAIDVSEKSGGSKSLQLIFDGEWNPGTPLISQTVLVAPNTIYPVSFSIKTKELATGGPLMLTVNDASSGELLGKSDNFPSTDSWVTLNFEFTTLETSKAAIIRLQRSNCDSSPCPIFGTVWLDDISIGQSRNARP
ncbi:MAG TPA: carbohydrate binding domain-containing protein [Pyrinomonadaceae bacterium]|nr:carbohydrate binding domain-containing protein [Pyrinomonadaceae bacterium]